VDLSAMRGVDVDPAHPQPGQRRRAARRADVAAQAHGLVCPVGVVGHRCRGADARWRRRRLQRQFGLTIDNLAAVELVTADGRLVRASETEEPELFWGMRGAGWNFGIATAFELRLQPFGPDLHRGILIFPVTEIQEVWGVFRDYARHAPDAVAVIFGIDRAGPDAGYPDDLVGRPIAYIAYNHSGAADAVERDTAGLHAGPRPVSATIGSQPYLDVQTAHDLVFAWGSRSYIDGRNGNDVRPEALDQLVELVATAPSEGTFSVTALGGAIGHVPEESTAYAGRTAAFDLSADCAWTDPSLDDACRDWVRRRWRWSSRDPRRLRERVLRGRPEATRLIYGDANRTPRGAEAGLGSRQRVPREPQRRARGGRAVASAPVDGSARDGDRLAARLRSLDPLAGLP
jgi:FAD/FMN-containing dehydrogenase